MLVACHVRVGGGEGDVADGLQRDAVVRGIEPDERRAEAVGTVGSLVHPRPLKYVSEALEARKALNDSIGELHSQVVAAAWQRVIYKEDRDIVEENEVSYGEGVERLEQARLAFRDLNRKLRAASFEATVDFRDE